MERAIGSKFTQNIGEILHLLKVVKSNGRCQAIGSEDRCALESERICSLVFGECTASAREDETYVCAISIKQKRSKP